MESFRSGNDHHAGLTAWRGLVVDGRLKAGETVLTMGTGGVSIAAIQIAKLIGATVIATSSSGEKLDRLRALGAVHVINYRELKSWGEEVRKLTGGRGVDHVIEIGGAGTLPQSIEAIRVGGHIALIGVLTGREGNIPTSALMRKQARLQGLIVASAAISRTTWPRSMPRILDPLWIELSLSRNCQKLSDTKRVAPISARSASSGDSAGKIDGSHAEDRRSSFGIRD